MKLKPELMQPPIIDKIDPVRDVQRMGYVFRRKQNILRTDCPPIYERMLRAKKQYLCIKEISNSFANTPMSEAYCLFLEVLQAHYTHCWVSYYGSAAYKHIKELGLNEIDVID